MTIHLSLLALTFITVPAVSAKIVADQCADLVLGRKFGDQDSFSIPSGIAVDPMSHKVFISDAARHRVLRFSSPASMINGSPAEAVLGQSDFTGDSPGNTFDASVALDRMNTPGPLFCDTGGRLWVCDTLNRRVLRFDNAATIASGARATRYLGDGGVEVDSSSIGEPAGVVLDGSGHLYVSDSRNHRIMRWNNAAGLGSGVIASAVLGQPNLTAGGLSSNGSSATELDSPRGLAMDSLDNLWVADYSNNRVLRFANPASLANGAPATTLIGQPDFGFAAPPALGASRIYHPVSIALDPAGTMYVASETDQRVLRYSDAAFKGGAVDADSVLGAVNLISAGVAGYTANGFRPTALATDGPARLWVADIRAKRVMRFDTPAAAANGAAAGGVLGAESFATIGNDWFVPDGVAVDPVSGKVFVVDEYNSRVLRFASTGSLHAGSVAEAVLGQTDFSSSVHDNGPSNLNFPDAIATDAAGRLWVADSGNNRVLRFDNAANLGNGAPANGVLGQQDFNGSGSGATPTAQNMHRPLGLATGAGGRLWVSDYENQRVLRFDNAAAKPNGAPANGVLGQTNFVSEGTELDANSFEGPLGLFEDTAGRLWVADSRHNRVLGWANAAAAADGVSATWLVGQTQYFTAVGGSLQRPSGVAVDAAGRLYVANSSRNTVVWFDGAGQTLAARPNPDGGVGRWSQAYDAIGTTTDRLEFPVSVALDRNGSLYVSDNRNTRVMRFLNFAPEIIDANILAGQFKFTFTCVPEQKYDIYRSENLGPWTKESTVTGPAGVNSLLYTSSMAVSGTRRQYRVAVP